MRGGAQYTEYVRLFSLLLGLLLLFPITSAEAKFVKGVKKRSIRQEQREKIQQRNARAASSSSSRGLTRASDLDDVMLYEDFRLGYSFEIPRNWSMSTVISHGSGGLLMTKFTTPIGQSHPGEVSITVARMRTSSGATPAQMMSNAIRLFYPRQKVSTPKPLKVGTGSGYVSTYTMRTGEMGRLVVVPTRDGRYAFVFLLRNKVMAYKQYYDVFNVVIKSLTLHLFAK